MALWKLLYWNRFFFLCKIFLHKTLPCEQKKCWHHLKEMMHSSDLNHEAAFKTFSVLRLLIWYATQSTLQVVQLLQSGSIQSAKWKLKELNFFGEHSVRVAWFIDFAQSCTYRMGGGVMVGEFCSGALSNQSHCLGWLQHCPFETSMSFMTFSYQSRPIEEVICICKPNCGFSQAIIYLLQDYVCVDV